MSWHDTYFVKIGGVSYEAELLRRANAFAKAGPLGLSEAEALWRSALDGRGVTATERRTIRYITEHLSWRAEGRAFLCEKLDEEESMVTPGRAKGGKSSGKGSKRSAEKEQPSATPSTGNGGKISGNAGQGRLEKAAPWPSLSRWLPTTVAGAWRRLFSGRPRTENLLQLAAKHAQDRMLRLRDVQALWKCAMDGRRVTETEQRTLMHIAETYALDEAAEEFLLHKLSTLGSGPPPADHAGPLAGPKPKRKRVGPFTPVFYSPGRGCDGRAALEELLSSASVRLDAALFVLTDDRLASVLIDRHKAGVKVRVLADNDAEKAFETSDLEKLRKAGIEVRLDRSKLHMHHKFAVVDGEVCVNGSLNWTTGALRNNRENIVISRSSSIAAIFAAEFQRLWTAFAPGALCEPGPAPTGVWHGDQAVLFFPDKEDANFRTLVAEVRSATKTLDVAVFTLTVAELKAAMKDAKARGVRVRVITDDRQAKFAAGGSHLKELRAAGLEVCTDGAGGNMHHKFCVIDRTTVCNGSFNWTRQAEDGNNENIIIYRNEPGLARGFTDEFERLWAEFAGK